MHLPEFQVVKVYSCTKSCTFSCEALFRREFKWNLKFLIACYKSKQCCFFPSWAPHCRMLHSFLFIVLMLGIVTELYRSLGENISASCHPQKPWRQLTELQSRVQQQQMLPARAALSQAACSCVSVKPKQQVICWGARESQVKRKKRPVLTCKQTWKRTLCIPCSLNGVNKWKFTLACKFQGKKTKTELFSWAGANQELFG